MRFLLIVVGALLLTGCASTPYKELNIDSTSNFKSPSEGKSGIYAYHWKPFTVLNLDLVNAKFEIKGQPKLSLGFTDYGYFELTPGDYKYLLSGGLIDNFIPVKFEANQNYFFRAYLGALGNSFAHLIRDQAEIDKIKKNILSGLYEEHSVK